MTKQNSYINVTVGPSLQKKEADDLGFRHILLCIVICLAVFGVFALIGKAATYGLEQMMSYTPSKAYTLDLFKGEKHD